MTNQTNGSADRPRHESVCIARAAHLDAHEFMPQTSTKRHRFHFPIAAPFSDTSPVHIMSCLPSITVAHGHCRWVCAVCQRESQHASRDVKPNGVAGSPTIFSNPPFSSQLFREPLVQSTLRFVFLLIFFSHYLDTAHLFFRFHFMRIHRHRVADV
jgi:hypothetical protein